LLGQHELASREIPPRFREQKGYLNGEDMLAIEILVQAVVVSDAILKK
jgi:hypothetical protein